MHIEVNGHTVWSSGGVVTGDKITVEIDASYTHTRIPLGQNAKYRPTLSKTSPDAFETVGRHFPDRRAMLWEPWADTLGSVGFVLKTVERHFPFRPGGRLFGEAIVPKPSFCDIIGGWKTWRRNHAGTALLLAVHPAGRDGRVAAQGQHEEANCLKRLALSHA